MEKMKRYLCIYSTGPNSNAKYIELRESEIGDVCKSSDVAELERKCEKHKYISECRGDKIAELEQRLEEAVKEIERLKQENKQ